MKVEIISRETIKPSSQTPKHLQTVSLSFLDQLAVPHYLPVLFVYTNGADDEVFDYIKVVAERHHRLKKSLSEVLTRFYPLAGSLKHDILVDCNDAGADYIEARVHARLSDVSMEPTNLELYQLMPDIGDRVGSILLVIKANVFECGGMAIVFSFSHKIADAASMSMFINQWALVSREVNVPIVQPLFNPASYFPSRIIPSNPMGKYSISKNVVTKKFLFDASKIASLKTKYQSSCLGKYFTRVEVVSAFIWECFINVSELRRRGGLDGIMLPPLYVASHVVNLRGKMGIPHNTFGNICKEIFTTPLTHVDTDEKKPDCVGLISSAIKSVDDDCMRTLQFGNLCPPLIMPVNDDRPIKVMKFVSWCKFPFFEADFGWGKPIGINDTPSAGRNAVVLMDTMSSDGIEAKITLLDEEMVKFECHLELVE